MFDFVSDRVLEPLGLDVGAIFGVNFGPRKVSKLKMPMCTKCCYLQYETMICALPRGPKIDEKSMPKRLQDKIRFQEATKTRKSAQHRPKLGPKIEQKIDPRGDAFGKCSATSAQVMEIRTTQARLKSRRAKELSNPQDI